MLAFKRILLKLSGEALAGDKGFGVETARIHAIAAEIKEVHDLGVEIALVVGGETFSAEWPIRPATWTASPPTIWACWRP